MNCTVLVEGVVDFRLFQKADQRAIEAIVQKLERKMLIHKGLSVGLMAAGVAALTVVRFAAWRIATCGLARIFRSVFGVVLSRAKPSENFLALIGAGSPRLGRAFPPTPRFLFRRHRKPPTLPP